jgi:hypothetical protein
VTRITFKKQSSENLQSPEILCNMEVSLNSKFEIAEKFISGEKIIPIKPPYRATKAVKILFLKSKFCSRNLATFFYCKTTLENKIIPFSSHANNFLGLKQQGFKKAC